jgi:membrane protein implicated in regulation of membrane protease activity
MLSLAGVGGPAWLQVLLFSAISIAALWLFREKLMQSFQAKAPAPVDSLIGETAHVVDGIAIDGVGKVELRGSSWNARNIGTTALAARERCIVDRVEGLTLYVKSENL